jgi:hypothetical protein
MNIQVTLRNGVRPPHTSNIVFVVFLSGWKTSTVAFGCFGI